MKPTEILEQENKCIQDEPVYCGAVCPVHVDVRAVAAYIQKGSFEQALQAFRSRALFPGVVSRVCDAPCERACIRKDIDDAVSIRLLERACADFGGDAKRKYSVFQKKERVAIIGGGLTGLSCALEIARKGYEATVYERGGRLGGSLWDVDPSVLPPDIIERDIAQLEQEGVHIKLNTCVDDLSGLEFDAAFIATGDGGEAFGLRSQDGSIAYDPVSLATNLKGVFAGGGLLGAQCSAIECVACGGRAARSIERYIKKASLTSGRESEDIQSTRLYTDISGITASPNVVPEGQCYTKEQAVAEAGRCLKCECMECVKACAFLDFFHQNPKQYIRDITKTVTSQQGLRSKMIATRVINSCSLCGQCKEICPNALDMGEICQEARYMQVQADSMPPAFYEFWLREFDFSTGAQAQLFKNQPGYDKSAYVFFPGCRMGSSDPGYVEKTYEYLTTTLDGGVGLALTCCGAPAEWSGHGELMAGHARRLAAQWEAMGKPEIIAACPTCEKMLSKRLPGISITPLWDVFLQHPLPWSVSGGGRSVAIYDPCASRYTPGVQQSVRKLLKSMGYTVEELRFSGRLAQCCSYGGLISTINPELAERIRQERTGANPNTYVTYCTNCRDDFAANGKPAWYMLDILFGNNDDSTAKRLPPTISERRENRKLLKKRMLEAYWRETMDEAPKPYETIKLNIPAELLEKMDREYILIEEIRQVIHNAETTGYRLIDSATKHFVAHLKIGIITYWAEYLPEGGGFKVFNAYSHRMQIVEVNRQ